MRARSGDLLIKGNFQHIPMLMVKSGSTFFSLENSKLEPAKQHSAPLRNLFVGYADWVFAQLLQSVACNAAHSIEQRAAKRIAEALDRTGDETVPFTHQELANMLGVGRSYASRVIERFKARGILETRRGALIIRDPAALRGRACRCNVRIELNYRHLFDER
jgi:hypothetical protein